MMRMFHFQLRSRTAKGAAVLAGLFLTGAMSLSPAQARPAKVTYAPGLSLVPEVFQADGASPQTYNTTGGTSLWTQGLPVPQGDKIKLNVFAATGGAELKEIRVRLDNVLLPGMPLVAAPWKTTLDTAALTPGYHMVEVWAQATGDRPQSTTKTLTFYVSRQLDAQYRVKPSLQQLQGGTTSTLPAQDTPESDAPPAAPEFLKDKSPDGNAQVVLSASINGASAIPVSGSSVSLAQPTLFVVQPAPGSTATRFTYALVRGGDVTAAPEAYGINSFRLRLQKKESDTGVGLNAGTVTLWIWGIDKDGRPADPVKTTLNVPE